MPSDKKQFQSIIDMDEMTSPQNARKVIQVEEVEEETKEEEEVQEEVVVEQKVKRQCKVDKRKIKLLTLRPVEHAYLVTTKKKKEALVCDYTYNDYNAGDYIKTNFDTFWKVKSVTYASRFQMIYDFNMCQDSILKLSSCMGVNGDVMSYSVLQLEESSYDEAVGRKSSKAKSKC